MPERTGADAMPGAGDAVDIAFELEGNKLAGDYSFDLMQEIARRLPWLESEPEAGIHPLRSAKTDAGALLLPRRAKLVLRLPRRRGEESKTLCGQELSVGGHSLKIGEAKTRVLLPFATLYAHFVTAPDETAPKDDELSFMSAVSSELRSLQTPCELVCGKRRILRAQEQEIVGYSLMLHGLALEHSIRVQRVGLGHSRILGCGIFVGHKSVAAVG
jgi:CRISPR-associated protein Cas6